MATSGTAIVWETSTRHRESDFQSCLSLMQTDGRRRRNTYLTVERLPIGLL